MARRVGQLHLVHRQLLVGVEQRLQVRRDLLARLGRQLGVHEPADVLLGPAAVEGVELVGHQRQRAAVGELQHLLHLLLRQLVLLGHA